MEINMKNMKKICIFVILSLVVCMAFATVAFAADAANDATTTGASNKLDMNLKPDSFGERAELALQGTVTGLLMVFSVLGLLAIIMTLSKIVFHDMPNKKKERELKKREESKSTPAAPVNTEAPKTEAPVPAEESVASETADDGELVAVITAAIAAMIESGEYKNEFVGGFRVVSFKRSTGSAWNKK